MNNNMENSNFSEEDINDILSENGVEVNNETASNEEEVQEESTENTEEEPQGQPDTSSEIIPTNSPSLLVDTATARFSGAEWFEEIQKTKITLAGLGGIGSNLSYQLARLNPKAIYLYDDDTIDRVNMAGQFYSVSDVGKLKANALYNTLNKYSVCTHIYAVPTKFTRETPASEIMICGFDNMEARKIFFYSWVNYVNNLSTEDRKKCLYIDGRLSFDTLQVLCITGDDDYNQNRYQNEFLFNDSEAEQTICSMKQTTYLACMIGSIMTNLLVNFITNQSGVAIPYDVPFFTEYNASHMLFNYEY